MKTNEGSIGDRPGQEYNDGRVWPIFGFYWSLTGCDLSDDRFVCFGLGGARCDRCGQPYIGVTRCTGGSQESNTVRRLRNPTGSLVYLGLYTSFLNTSKHTKRVVICSSGIKDSPTYVLRIVIFAMLFMSSTHYRERHVTVGDLGGFNLLEISRSNYINVCHTIDISMRIY